MYHPFSNLSRNFTAVLTRAHTRTSCFSFRGALRDKLLRKLHSVTGSQHQTSATCNATFSTIARQVAEKVAQCNRALNLNTFLLSSSYSMAGELKQQGRECQPERCIDLIAECDFMLECNQLATFLSYFLGKQNIFTQNRNETNDFYKLERGKQEVKNPAAVSVTSAS